MYKYLLTTALYFISASSNAGDFNCADNKFLKKTLKTLTSSKTLTSEQITDTMIDLAYNSGPQSGNFGNEIELNLGAHLHGLLFLSKENSKGNLRILESYPELNTNIFQSRDSTIHLDKKYRHNYSGMFQITYDATRECRRQILITGFEQDNATKEYFYTGWINVEICDPKIAQLFAAGAQYFEAQGKKMETINDFFKAMDSLSLLGKVPADAAKQLKEKLNTDEHPEVYYAKNKTGHIAPRFSVPIKQLFFTNNTKKQECTMTMLPSSPYSGILSRESHIFSQDIQKIVFDDFSKNQASPKNMEDTLYMQFWLSHWDENGNSVRTAAVLNSSLNKNGK